MTREEAITKLNAQVQQAHRRLILQRFMSVLAWTMSATLFVVVIAIAVPKFWAFALEPSIWFWSWLSGGLLVGILCAVVWTFFTKSSPLDAAIEVDQRFQLKERVSSTLSLAPDEMDGAVGQALLSDAMRRIEGIDVCSEFPLRLGWRSLFPLVPALLAFFLVLLPNAEEEQRLQAAQTKQENKKQIKASTEKLKKQAWNKKKKAERLGLKEAQGTFDKLSKGLDELQDANKGDKRDALRKLSNLNSELQKRRELLGGAREMQKQFRQLKNMKSGPADKFAKAMRDGDYDKAIASLKSLQQKLQQGDMNGKDQKKLVTQMNQMTERLQQMVAAQRQAKKQLQQQIADAKQQGDQERANQLQQKLDQLNQQNQQMSQLEKMAQQLSQCSECMKKGQSGSGESLGEADMASASSELDNLTKELEQMRLANAELDMLDEALDQIAMAKGSMNCQQCSGMGCAACQGQSPIPGEGLGEGRGQGDRPEESSNTSFYDTRVKADSSLGKAVVIGDVGGPNKAGDTRVAIQEQIEAFSRSDGDPLLGKQLPKAQRDHVQEYFGSLKPDEE
ncbi:MAG: hypothetical protein MK179_13240 [Pirellulaceae bacterium]|nr:hypothetical protein [Pirellulaceae bacterium]